MNCPSCKKQMKFFYVKNGEWLTPSELEGLADSRVFLCRTKDCKYYWKIDKRFDLNFFRVC